MAGEQDHISHWQVVYKGAKLYSASCNQQFVLSTSGHIMGLINSTTNHACSYRTNNSLPDNSNVWLENSTEHSGSWWPYWLHWLTNICVC